MRRHSLIFRKIADGLTRSDDFTEGVMFGSFCWGSVAILFGPAAAVGTNIAGFLHVSPSVCLTIFDAVVAGGVAAIVTGYGMGIGTFLVRRAVRPESCRYPSERNARGFRLAGVPVAAAAIATATMFALG